MKNVKLRLTSFLFALSYLLSNAKKDENSSEQRMEYPAKKLWISHTEEPTTRNTTVRKRI